MIYLTQNGLVRIQKKTKVEMLCKLQQLISDSKEMTNRLFILGFNFAQNTISLENISYQ